MRILLVFVLFGVACSSLPDLFGVRTFPLTRKMQPECGWELLKCLRLANYEEQIVSGCDAPIQYPEEYKLTLNDRLVRALASVYTQPAEKWEDFKKVVKEWNPDSSPVCFAEVLVEFDAIQKELRRQTVNKKDL